MATRRKRMRLPNGFGSITELKGRNLRKPFYARVSIAKDERGRPKVVPLKPVAYFRTYNEAYMALMDYNRSHKDIARDLTVAEVYQRFLFKEEARGLSKVSINSTKRAFRRSEPLHSMQISDVRPRHLRNLLSGLDITANEQYIIKTFWNKLFDYAIQYEYAVHNYAKDFKLPDDVTKELKETKREHVPFSDWEMESLWENASRKEVKWILIQCYMGWRPSELCSITLKDIDLEKKYIKGGIKTEAGIDRIVPIHTAVFPMVKTLYDEALQEGLSRLLTFDGEIVDYETYNDLFHNIIDTLGLSEIHRPHDPRKTFVTMAKKAGVDEYALKLLVGHKIDDITEAVYTKRDLEWLRGDIEKIECTNNTQLVYN